MLVLVLVFFATVGLSLILRLDKKSVPKVRENIYPVQPTWAPGSKPTRIKASSRILGQALEERTLSNNAMVLSQ
jgi:hypothetical protein